jgi:restriction system protein
MNNKNTVVWAIRAGHASEADLLFLKKNVIALGWYEAGDLSALKADREDFKALVAKAYPNAKSGSYPVSAGQLFRFVHEMKVGDMVVYPSKSDRQIHIGQVEGDYAYNPKLESAYPNTRPVKWLKTLPRTAFSQGALYEIGSALSLFQIKTYTDEFLAALAGKSAPLNADKDETVAYVVAEIEETTRDFILKRLAQQLKGHLLAHFIAHLLQAMGYRTRVAPEGPDGGIDIIAHKDELGFVPPIVKVQVKSSEDKIGEPVVAGLYGKVGQGEYGLFVTLGSFTNQAITFARNKSNLRLIGGLELVDLVLQHYEQFDPHYKGLIPLKRVYIPDEDAEA